MIIDQYKIDFLNNLQQSKFNFNYRLSVVLYQKKSE